MTIKKIGGKYRLDIRPNGAKGKRVIKLFNSKCEALQFKNQLLSGRFDTRAEQAVVDNRRLNDLIQLWFDLHGLSLKSSVGTKRRLLNLSNKLGNPVARIFSPELLAEYRKNRLDQGISPSTLNRELITLKALFRELKRLSVIDYDSLLLSVRKFKEKKTELSYLTHDEVKELLKQSGLSKNESLSYVVLICLITGARWSEAQGLSVQNCYNNGISFEDTKNGLSRFIPVSSGYFLLIKNRLVQGNFKPCYRAYRSAFLRCGFTVPGGQLSHIMRHTFASHFAMNGGNLRALQQILGHSSLQMTMRYSHLAPNFMNQVVELNPLGSGKIMEILPVNMEGSKNS